ncbi:MAG TPA: SPOR domain-containing protein [Terriglobales bacterium]|nr:SPOR domain-containing protein [Terriglobales bacterium]
MAKSEDTEITLGTGKMLVLFFGLVVVCAAFFGVGFSLGRNSAKPMLTTQVGTVQPANATIAHPADKPASGTTSPDMSFYKAVQASDAPAELKPEEKATPETATPPPSKPVIQEVSAPTTPVLNGYSVQVAAVSKQEDAEALVGALKKKQYQAFIANSSGNDKLFHVQVGPFAEVKDAESIRVKLISDGYNPILKK